MLQKDVNDKAVVEKIQVDIMASAIAPTARSEPLICPNSSEG